MRHFRASRLALGDVQVEIQSMGESITEGTIAEILKKEGDAVAEDETIAQIETDKVTIDIKSPVSGTVAELKMAVEDTVKVGQLVAVISGGQGGDSSSETVSTEPEPASKEPARKEPGQESTAPEAEAPGYKPGIKFPPRMTPDGRRISELGAEERSRYSEGSKDLPAAKSSQQPPPPPPKKDTSERSQAMPWYVGQEQGTKLSQSRVLSQREMEQIELGGADP